MDSASSSMHFGSRRSYGSVRDSYSEKELSQLTRYTKEISCLSKVNKFVFSSGSMIFFGGAACFIYGLLKKDVEIRNIGFVGIGTGFVILMIGCILIIRMKKSEEESASLLIQP